MSKNSVKPGRNDRDTELPAELPGGDQEETEMAQQQSEQAQQIVETGAVTPTKGKYTIHCLTIVGQIEGHYILSPQNKTTKYEHVIPQLVSIQENPDIEGLIIILNTVGGDVEAGLAIAELVSGMRKPSVSLVLGGGHSIGVPLAVSANKSFIAPSATMTIHPVRMNGTVLGVPQTLSYFEKMQERITGFVEENSNMSPKKFRQMMMNTGELVMDVGTVITGKQAVEVGLIDYVGGLSDAIECLYDLIEEYKASHRAEEVSPVDSKAENRNETRNPAPQLRQHGEGTPSPIRKRRRAGVRMRRGAVAQASDYTTAQKSERGSERERYVPSSARGGERQNRPPEADFPMHNKHNGEEAGHTMNRDAAPYEYGYGGKEPPSMNPYGHPGPGRKQ